MGLKDSVFASKSERRGFQQIDSEWGHKYSLYPNLPFSIIFEPDKSISGTSNLFFKTSIDYTLCGKNDKPLLAIDSDGLGHGFNRGTEYAGVRTTSDPYRKAKFEFKLRYAKCYELPYYVVSYDEFEPVGDDIHLTIVDCVIGQELARRDVHEQISQISVEDLEGLDPQTVVTDLEVEAEFLHDPIVKKWARLSTELRKLGCEVKSEAYQTFEYPELPYADAMHLSVESFKARVDGMKEVVEVGCVYTLLTSVGEISDSAKMRNVGDFGQALVIVVNVAEMLAYAKTLRIVQRHGIEAQPT